MPLSLIPFATKEKAEEAALHSLYEDYQRACDARGSFNLALSGGSSPLGLYRCLLEDSRFDLNLIHFYWADERIFPHESDQSNYGQFIRLAKSMGRFCPNTTPLYDPDIGVEKSLEKTRSALMQNTLDAIILGIGADGHSASLFPQSLVEGQRGDLSIAELIEKIGSLPQNQIWSDPSKDRICDHYLSVDNGQLRERVSLTARCIQKATSKYYLTFGSGKKEILEKIFYSLDNAAAPSLPAERLLGDAESQSSMSTLFFDEQCSPYQHLIPS